MRIDKFDFETIVTAERGMFLKYKDETMTVEKVGKPERIIFSNKGIIPELEELPLEYDGIVNTVELKEEVKEETKPKTSKKKSSK